MLFAQQVGNLWKYFVNVTGRIVKSLQLSRLGSINELEDVLHNLWWKRIC